MYFSGQLRLTVNAKKRENEIASLLQSCSKFVIRFGGFSKWLQQFTTNSVEEAKRSSELVFGGEI